MRRISCETFLELRCLSDIAVSSDGRYAAYTARTPELSGNGYPAELRLLCLEDGSDRRLAGPGPARAYSWLDERTLVYPSAGAEGTDYMALPIDGGEASVLFSVPFKAGKALPLGGGRFAFTAPFAMRGEPDASFDVLEDIPFWSNGAGFTAGKRNQLYVYGPEAGAVRLTEPPFTVAGFTVSDERILYTGSRFTDVQTLRHGVYVWDGGESRCLLEQDRYIVKLFDIWRDRAVLCLTDGLSYGNGENGDFFTIPLAGGEPELLLRHSDRCVGSTVGTDCRLGAGSAWRVDGDTLYSISTVERSSRIEALDLTSGEVRLLTGEGSVEFLDAAAGRLVYLAFRGGRPGELYTLDGGAEKRLTHANDALFESLELSVPEPIEADTGAPVPVQGWVMKPVGCEPGRKYPAILSIHGGPRLSYGGVFFHELQLWAAEGYFVLFCNPRGSEGRGNEFADIRGRFGSIDFEDIMGFVDAALERYPDIDSKRLGVGGGSYGGFMTNWIIGHTDRFAAACSQRSIADWTGMEGTTDIGYYFAKGQTGASHRDDRAKQWGQSPLRYADRVSTPTLFLHGELDFRCYKTEALAMFTALKLRGVDTRLCLFEGENHELSRSGRPRQRLKRLEEMLAWYNRYLKDMEG